MLLVFSDDCYRQSSGRHVERVPNWGVHHGGEDVAGKFVEVGLAAETWGYYVVEVLRFPPGAKTHTELGNLRFVSEVVSNS